MASTVPAISATVSRCAGRGDDRLGGAGRRDLADAAGEQRERRPGDQHRPRDLQFMPDLRLGLGDLVGELVQRLGHVPCRGRHIVQVALAATVVLAPERTERLDARALVVVDDVLGRFVRRGSDVLDIVGERPPGPR
uniref:hypothetical protein n=1 Tax=Streptomyces rimosus TaxID=1927 RepID=UPI0013311626